MCHSNRLSCVAALLQALNLRGCTNVSSECLKYLSTLTRITDLCLLHNSKLEVDDACLASLAKLPNLRILGLGNFQVGMDEDLVPQQVSNTFLPCLYAHLLSYTVHLLEGRLLTWIAVFAAWQS